jgi:hypothetical protein
MNTRLHPSASQSSNRGMATIAVIVILFVVLSFLAANTVALHNLKRELRRVEQLQLRRYGPALVTNRVQIAIAVSRPEEGQVKGRD